MQNFEENLDILAFVVNPDDFLFADPCVGAQDGQLFIGPAIPNKDNFGFD